MLFVFLLAGVWFGRTTITHANCNYDLEKSLSDDLLNMMLKIKRPGQEHKDQTQTIAKRAIPAFSAYRATSLPVEGVVIFDKYWTNYNESYDTKTGIFTVPMNGIYSLSVVGMSVKGFGLALRLTHNNVTKGGGYADGNGYNLVPINVILKLKKGDRIFVKTPGMYTVYGDNENHSTFSGYLVSQ